MNSSGKPLKATGIEAKCLLTWLEEHFELEGARPLVGQMLQTASRLQQVRAEIKKAGIVIDGKPNPLLAIEHRLGEQFLKCWRTLGLADAPEQERRGPGRPPESERRWRA